MSQLSFERNVQILGVGKYLPKNQVLAKDIENETSSQMGPRSAPAAVLTYNA